MDPERRERTLLYASGVAAALLVLILVYAVIHTAQSSRHQPSAPVSPLPHTTSHPAPRTASPTPTAPTSPTTTTTTAITSTGATSSTPTESAAQIVPPPEPSSSTPETMPPTPTTIPNPYVTTSPPNAGAY